MGESNQSIYGVEDTFRDWLKNDKKLSTKVACDVISRCKKVERDLEIDLIQHFSTDVSYLKLMRAIGNHCKQNCATAAETHSKTAALRYSVRRLLEFHSPEKVRTFKMFRY